MSLLSCTCCLGRVAYLGHQAILVIIVACAILVVIVMDRTPLLWGKFISLCNPA